MYYSHYGLTEPPFELTSNPRSLFLTAGHREALSGLVYALTTGKAVTLLLGEAGTGKTTLLRAALESDECSGIQAVLLNNPTLTRDEFIEILTREFNLGADAARSKARFLEVLEQRLMERRAVGQGAALIVDEGQSMTRELLEEIRLLGNIETESGKLLPLVLAGQPELSARLNEPDLRQLKQRIALRCEVSPFSLQESATYISVRIRTAGGDAVRLFTREAVILIHERSSGIPRTVNVICDNALLTAFAVGKERVDRDIVLEVCRDLDLDRSRRAERAPTAAQRPLAAHGAPPAASA